MRVFPNKSEASAFAQALLVLGSILLGNWGRLPVYGEDTADLKLFREQIKPILEEKCFDCHAYGMKEGSVAFDGFDSDAELIAEPELWYRALRMLRSGLMPPAEMSPLTSDEFEQIEQWIKSSAFHGDPSNPDPGQVTLRRLNRVEYHNTIRDLLGVDYNVQETFPQDDTGHGFDTLGEVLTMSPMLLEKYLTAAREIVDQVVPKTASRISEKIIAGQYFRPEGQQELADPKPGPLWLSYRTPAWVSYDFNAKNAGRYQLILNLQCDETYTQDKVDSNRCRVTFSVDGEERFSQEFIRQDSKPLRFECEVAFQAGTHPLTFELKPLTPDAPDVRKLTLRITQVNILGPLEKELWEPTPGYDKVFPRPVPNDAEGRLSYARELLGEFASRAYRRPVGDETAVELAALAESIYSQPGGTFEEGISEAMTAVLVSPRFLFREDFPENLDLAGSYANLDEYSLATRLSYFLWSTMPDEELFGLAAEGKLRKKLPAQLDRMLQSERSEQLIHNFVGQWLRSREIEHTIVNGPAVARRDQAPNSEYYKLRDRFLELHRRPDEDLSAEERVELIDLRKQYEQSKRRFADYELDSKLRRAMREETELVFETILREDRSLLELLDSDYTFLNERLAHHYQIEGVKGKKMRLVNLPEGSVRGGILTQGTMLVVTSNPDRTSPVKRGLYILDNILGMPPPPPPPNLPALEDAGTPAQKRTFTVAEALALHRAEPLCSSCHNRMDPLGLALEQFNALGVQREYEHGKPIATEGKLITGENFADIRELKQILANEHRIDFYRCLAEKLLIYALGRGIDYHDTETIDAIVEQLDDSGGRPSVLIKGIVTSAAFQKCHLERYRQKIACSKSAQRN